ncbi:MAG: mycothiol synthase [Streptosporangiales bacterium]
MTSVVGKDELDSDDAAQVMALAKRAAAADGVPPLSEQVLLAVRPGDRENRKHLLVHTDGLAGYAQVDLSAPAGTDAEIVVAPEARRAGHGRSLVEAAASAAGSGPLRVWAHGELPAAVAFAQHLGFARTRALWQMARPLGGSASAVPEPALPPGVAIRTFDASTDAEAWLELNATAFADHAEQGRMTLRDLHDRMREPWFDSAGFFIAERGDALVGFHWTKTVDETGEVYVIGVHPSEQGHGLGKALLLVGLLHLARNGLARVTLYVEADNAGAIALYAKLGFVHTGTDAMFTHSRDHERSS